MPSSLTKLQVWNLAIDVIRDTALQSTTDNAATARWLERNDLGLIIRDRRAARAAAS